MAVVRATYFKECWRRGEPFQDRAKIPEEAFIDGQEVVDLWVEFGFAFLVVISYPWLSEDHPDPAPCFHLPRLVRALEAFKSYHQYYSWKGEKRDRMLELGGGVILDYCSFFQGKRNEEQDHLFKEGLNLINIPYGHRDATALKLISMPSSQVRKYDDRGWTLFESTVIDGKAPSARHTWGERNVLTCADDFDPEGATVRSVLEALSTAQRKPPLTPLRFRAELQRRRDRAEAKGVRLFTNNKDSPVILDRYDASFAALCLSTKLDYTDMKWGVAEAKELVLALPAFSALEQLSLGGAFRASEAGEAVVAIAEALPRCSSLQQLFLYRNSLGNSTQAVVAIAEALAHCSSLQVLHLDQNRLGSSTQAVATLAAALPGCVMLRKLDLSDNTLGQNVEAVAGIAGALPRCASLQELHMRGNSLDERAKASLRNAWLAAGKSEDKLQTQDALF